MKKRTKQILALFILTVGLFTTSCMDKNEINELKIDPVDEQATESTVDHSGGGGNPPPSSKINGN